MTYKADNGIECTTAEEAQAYDTIYPRICELVNLFGCHERSANAQKLARLHVAGVIDLKPATPIPKEFKE